MNSRKSLECLNVSISVTLKILGKSTSEIKLAKISASSGLKVGEKSPVKFVFYDTCVLERALCLLPLLN